MPAENPPSNPADEIQKLMNAGGGRGVKMRGPQRNSEIAIIGLACRFPGATTPEAYWKNLCQGIESITFFSEQELVAAGVDPSLVANPNYVKAAPILRDVEMFDAGFFGIC